MKIVKDLTNKRFGRLLVERLSNKRSQSRKIMYYCLCDCGQRTVVAYGNLVYGTTTSCGCHKRSVLGEITRIHGLRNTPEYAVFRTMKQRCTDTKTWNYKNYGGRGIKCLYSSFNKFISDVGRRPFKSAQINRINNDGNYEPGNVNWVTRSENCKNRRARAA
jgi:hypothetical protein